MVSRRYHLAAELKKFKSSVRTIKTLELSGGVNDGAALNIAVALFLEKVCVAGDSPYDFRDFNSLNGAGIGACIALSNTPKFSLQSASNGSSDSVLGGASFELGSEDGIGDDAVAAGASASLSSPDGTVDSVALGPSGTNVSGDQRIGRGAQAARGLHKGRNASKDSVTKSK